MSLYFQSLDVYVIRQAGSEQGLVCHSQICRLRESKGLKRQTLGEASLARRSKQEDASTARLGQEWAKTHSFPDRSVFTLVGRGKVEALSPVGLLR